MILLIAMFFQLTFSSDTAASLNSAKDSVETMNATAVRRLEKSESSDSEKTYPRGISFSAGRVYYYSSFSDFRAQNYDFYLGMGYNLSPAFLAMLKIYTGSEYFDGQFRLPVSGKLALGGGALEITYRLVASGKFRPNVNAGYELSTSLTSGSSSSGYNGSGFHFQLGMEYFVLENISFDIDALYRYRRYTTWILRGNFIGDINMPIDRQIGINLSLFVHFNALP